MKKIFTLFLAFAASIGTMFAEFDRSNKIQIGELFYYLDYENNEAEVASKNDGGYSGDIVIPDTFSFDNVIYKVTSIGNYAFYYCTSLTSVSLPNSIISIRKEAFRKTNISTIDIPNSVVNIDTMAFQECSNLVSISMSNNLQRIAFGTFYGCNNLIEFTIPTNVITIEDVAFANCNSLASVSIPNKVTNIGRWAFSYCPNLNNVTNYATTPQVIPSNVFDMGVDRTACLLYVPKESITLYQNADVWNDFTNILPISARDIETNTVNVTPSETTAEVVWPTVSGAVTYELVIRDNNGNVICTLDFNANGQLTSISFNAPSRDQAPQQTQASGFSFVVTGLEEGTEYNLTIIAKDSDGEQISAENMSFSTAGKNPTALDQIANDHSPMANKIVKDGQILILRGDKTYTLTGEEVK